MPHGYPEQERLKIKLEQLSVRLSLPRCETSGVAHFSNRASSAAPRIAIDVFNSKNVFGCPVYLSAPSRSGKCTHARCPDPPRTQSTSPPMMMQSTTKRSTFQALRLVNSAEVFTARFRIQNTKIEVTFISRRLTSWPLHHTHVITMSSVDRVEGKRTTCVEQL